MIVSISNGRKKLQVFEFEILHFAASFGGATGARVAGQLTDTNWILPGSSSGGSAS